MEDLVQTDAPLATELSGHQNAEAVAKELVKRFDYMLAAHQQKELTATIVSALRSAVEAEREPIPLPGEVKDV